MYQTQNNKIDFFKKRPEMQKIFNNNGNFNDYITELTGRITNKESKGTFAQKIATEAKRILTSKISSNTLESQLTNTPLISYADHHGFLNYKLLYNSNLLYAELIKKLELPYVVAFASGNVPMVNKSHPRGFYFKGRKFNFFPERKCKMPLFLFENIIIPNKKAGIDSFISSYDKNLITKDEKQFLEFLFFEALQIDSLGDTVETFSDQLTVLNYNLWKYYFANELRYQIPELIYLQSNEIVLDILIHEIENPDSLISLILFNQTVRQIFLKNFFGIPCCWGEDMGSQFFWGISSKKKLRSLHVDEYRNSLVSQDFQLELNRELIIDSLKTRTIIPTIFLDFLIITFLNGYNALGGFNQIEYLQQMQHAHIASLREIGMEEMAQTFAARITNGLICGMFPFDFDSGIDLLWQYNSQNGKFNGNLDGGLTQEDLNTMLNMEIKEMILSAIDLMLANM